MSPDVRNMFLTSMVESMILSKGYIGFRKSFGENSGRGEVSEGALGTLGLRHTQVGPNAWDPGQP